MARTEVRGGQILDASVSLTADVTGTLPVGNGGLGVANPTAASVLVGNGSSAVTGVAPGTSGNVLTSNGSAWASTAPAASGGGISGVLEPVQVMTTGAETFTVASGSVTQIAGTTVQTYSPAIGDRILISNAPASTGTGSSFGHSTQPGNGIYDVTGNTTNLTLSRSADLSGTVYPAGLSVFVERGASWLGAVQMIVTTPLGTGTGTHTWGTNTVKWDPNGGLAPTFNGTITAGNGIAANGNISPLATNTVDLGTSSLQWRDLWISRTPTFASGIPAANIPTGLTNGNTSTQSQVTVSATAYYIAGSNLNLPNPMKAGLVVGSRFRWTVAMAKTAAGTGTFEIIIYRGTAGTTADTADVAQSIGTQTAVVDNMTVDVEVVVTTTGATGAYYWAIIPTNKAVTATGFGVAAGPTGQFSGTKSSVAMNTAALIFGLGFRSTTGTPTITVPMVRSQALNVM